MIDDKKVLAIIPARGGSKGIKNKNIVELCGKPLIAYTIIAALQCEYIDKVVVSTDYENIAEVAREYGAAVPFLRSAKLAEDHSKTIDAIMEVIHKLDEIGEQYDVCVLLQPTSPLRNASDITGALEKFSDRQYKSLVAVSEVQDHPVLIRRIDENDRMETILSANSTVRRQDMDKYYRVNGSIYINRIDEINANTSFNDNCIPYIVSEEHAVDIDEMIDLYIAEYYLSKTFGK